MANFPEKEAPKSSGLSSFKRPIMGRKQALPATDRLLVLEQGGEPVGVGVVHLTPLAHEADHRARLTALVIDGRVRSRGLGAKLLTACEEAAQSMRCSSLELTTASWRQDAHRFYERQGYAVVSRRYSKLLR